MKLPINKKLSFKNINIIFMLFIFISPIIRFTLGFTSYLIALGIIAGFTLKLLSSNYYRGYKAIVPFLFILSMVAFTLIANPSDLKSIYFSFIFLINFLIAYWLEKQNPEKLASISFLSLIIYFIFFIYSMIKHGTTATDINHYLLSGEASRNMVSAIAILYQITYSATYYRVNSKLPLITPLLTLCIAIIAYGRSGIALSASIVIFSIIYETWKSKKIYKLIYFFLALAILFLFIENFAIIENFLFENTNYQKGFESPREIMVQQYIINLGFIEILGGLDLSNIPIIKNYNNNPHNSLIFGHSMYGIFYLALLIWIITSITLHYFYNKETFVYIVLLSIFFSRLLIDTISMPGIFDFMFFLVFLIIINSKKTSKIGVPKKT